MLSRYLPFDGNRHMDESQPEPVFSTMPASVLPGFSSIPAQVLKLPEQVIPNVVIKLKCPFCDTPFISKGAYRHHLSKMHFVKDGSGNGGDLMSGKNFMKTPEKSPGGQGSQGGASQADNAASAGGAVKEENAQSKFQKYSQMAKQLSCSGQP